MKSDPILRRIGFFLKEVFLESDMIYTDTDKGIEGAKHIFRA